MAERRLNPFTVPWAAARPPRSLVMTKAGILSRGPSLLQWVPVERHRCKTNIDGHARNGQTTTSSRGDTERPSDSHTKDSLWPMKPPHLDCRRPVDGLTELGKVIGRLEAPVPATRTQNIAVSSPISGTTNFVPSEQGGKAMDDEKTAEFGRWQALREIVRKFDGQNSRNVHFLLCAQLFISTQSQRKRSFFACQDSISSFEDSVAALRCGQTTAHATQPIPSR